MFVFEAGGVEDVGVKFGAGEEDGFGHFAEEEFEHEGREWDDGGSVDDVAESFCELDVGDGVGRGEVDGAGDLGVGEAVVDGACDVGVGHPAHVLFAGAEFSAEAEFEGGEHTLECAACLAEDDADAHVDGTDAVVFGGLCHVFPFA